MKLSSMSPCCPGSDTQTVKAPTSRSHDASVYSVVVFLFLYACVWGFFCKRNASSDVCRELGSRCSLRPVVQSPLLDLVVYEHMFVYIYPETHQCWISVTFPLGERQSALVGLRSEYILPP